MKLNKTSEDRLIRKLFSGPDPKEHLMHTSSKVNVDKRITHSSATSIFILLYLYNDFF
jgi:hypothetical protein